METIQLLLGLLLVLLVSAFFLRSFLQRFLTYFAYILLAIGGVGAILGVFATRPFEAMAYRTLQKNGTIETIKTIDSYLKLESAVVPVTNLVENIKNWWNKTPSAEDEDVEKIDAANAPLLEKNLVPRLVTSLMSIYKSVTLVLSFALLVLAVYLNYLNASASEIAVLTRKYQQLEAKISQYEKEGPK
ncbi:MAG: hypothetical protein ACOYT9_04580 [Patescibacteria group bacterium]